MAAKTSLWNKLLFFFNSILAFFLLLSYALPYVFPSAFPFLSVLSLTLPVLIVINAFFLFYWIVKLHRYFLLSFFVLALGYKYLNALYQNNAHKPKDVGVHVMSFNARLFNHYGWIKEGNVQKQIQEFIANEAADIIAVQEFHKDYLYLFDAYSYQYVQTGNGKMGQAIFTNFPILNQGNIGFTKTANGAIFTDILIKNDTIRFYNIHLESLRINPKEEIFTQEKSQKLLNRMGVGFTNQQLQSEQVKLHSQNSPYPNILSGDFNNTQFSYVYKNIRNNYKDAFEEAGKGIGTTYDFKLIPLRIDFILYDSYLPLHSFETHSESFSDHKPISARFELN